MSKSNVPKRKVYTLRSNQSDPLVRTVGIVLLVVLGLLFFFFLLRLAGCGRPELLPVASKHWDAPKDDGSVADWIEGVESPDEIAWERLPNPIGGRRVRDRWRASPPVVHPVPVDRIVPVPDEEGGRLVVSGYLNIYASAESNLRELALEISQEFPDEFVDVVSYREEYKRITIDFVVPEQKNVRKALEEKFSEVEFIFDETVFKDGKHFRKSEERNWPLNQVEIEQAWMNTRGDAEVVVAVIDGMFNASHPSLRGRTIDNWDVPGYDETVQVSAQLFSTRPETASHGTHVAALVGGDVAGTAGFGGFAPGCKLMLIQLSDDEAGFYTSRIVDALFYAKHHGAKVINLSLGTAFSEAESVAALSQEEQWELASSVAIEEAESWDKIFSMFAEQGVAVVKAAGNDAVVADFDPMNRSDKILVVGACDPEGRRADFSNFGEEVDVYAPGTDILSASADGGLVEMSGTSMAAPIAAGVVALIRSARPELSPVDVFDVVRNSAKSLHEFTPILNAGAAFKYLEVTA
jgi:serine protease